MDLFAWVGVDELGSGEVGLKQVRVPAGFIPLVATSREKIDREPIRLQLTRQAAAYGQRIRLVRFTLAEEIESIEPQPDQAVAEEKQLEADYDAECEELRERLGADGCILVVIGGSKGTGAAFGVPDEFREKLPELFRGLARILEGEDFVPRSAPVCPVCKKAFAAITCNSRKRPHGPKAGDIAICTHCASFLRFETPPSVRLLSLDEVAALPDDMRNQLVRARRTVEESRGDQEK
jgi:hypothetical protein